MIPVTVKLLDFYTEWCGPCKSQDPILAELEAEWEDVEFERVDAEQSQDVANDYHVRSFPTLVVETDEGIVDRFVGLTQAEDIESALEAATA